MSFDSPSDDSRDPGCSAEGLGEGSNFEEEGGEEGSMGEGEERGSFSCFDKDGDSSFEGFEEPRTGDGSVFSLWRSKQKTTRCISSDW